jgi:hypothetical protein
MILAASAAPGALCNVQARVRLSKMQHSTIIRPIIHAGHLELQ